MLQFFNKQKEKEGFTLIELLVVIAVIGLLATVVIVNLRGVPKKARAAKAKEHLAVWMTAIESAAALGATSSASVCGSFDYDVVHWGGKPQAPPDYTYYCYDKTCSGSDNNGTFGSYCLKATGFSGTGEYYKCTMGACSCVGGDCDD